MNHETFIKLASGTRDDFAIACNWLVTYKNPITYIEEHDSKIPESNSTICRAAIMWDKERPYWELGDCIYYKYKDIYILKSSKGITVTDLNYDGSAEVIIH